MKAKKTSLLNLPSVNASKYSPKVEAPILKKSITNYFKTAMLDNDEIDFVFKCFENDPFLKDEKSCIDICKVYFPGKKLADIRPRCSSALWEYVKCLRKMYF